MKTVFLALALVISATAGARAEESTAERAQRWQDLQQAIFGDRHVGDGQGIIALDAPVRALDASLVPIGITLTGAKPVKSIYLVIDNNPSPLAAHLIFGPAADPHEVKLRVRVNEYTDMHAVAETADGELYAVMKFVKAAGGCSAPTSADETAALKQIGRMKLKLAGAVAPGKPLEALLMIRHPNFNGMQMDQLTRQYTPAHFVQSTDVTYNGTLVFHLDSDISLSTDPVVGFAFLPQDKGMMKVEARDSENMKFAHEFEIPAMAAERVLKRVWLPLVLLLFAATNAGAADPAQHPEPKGFWTGALKGPVPATITGGQVIHTKELDQLRRQSDAVLIDVSPAPHKPEGLAPNAVWMPPPHKDILSSVWLADLGRGRVKASQDKWFKARLAELTFGKNTRPLVVYCHPQCWASWNAAKRLILYGYRTVYWYPDGIEGWQQAGSLPTAPAQAILAPP